MTYKHLTEMERDQLAILRSQGKTLREIGRLMGRSPASLCRELRRNSVRGRYYPHHAQQSAVQRERDVHRRPRLKNHALRLQIEQWLQEGWSPEIIAGRLKRDSGQTIISHEAIYQWIYTEAPHLIQTLVRSHPKRWPRHYSRKRYKTHIPRRISIQDRPALINTRQQPGHWEADLVIGRGKAALQVAVERKARYTRLQKIPDKTARSARRALHASLKDLPAILRRSVTYDNGSENVEHLRLNFDLKMDSYFCQPYHSWEKGTVENTNGLIRRFLPKKTNFDMIPDDQIRRIESWLNNRPRKCLGFQSPAEVLTSFVALDG